MARKIPLTPLPAIALTDFAKTLDANFDKALNDPENFPGMREAAGNPVTLAPSVPEASDWVDKMVTNVMAAGDNWLKGVLRPKKEPIAEAKKANARYKAQMQASLAEDRWLKGIENIDEAGMYVIVQALGPSVFTQGVQARKAKITAAITKMRPLLVALKQTIEAMPNVTDADRDARVLANLRGMRALGAKLKTLR